MGKVLGCGGIGKALVASGPGVERGVCAGQLGLTGEMVGLCETRWLAKLGEWAGAWGCPPFC